MTTSDLLIAVRKLLQAGERINARFAEQLARVLRESERRMVPILTAALNEGGLRAFDAAALVATRDGLRAALTDAGYDALVYDMTGTRLEALAERIRALGIDTLGGNVRLTLDGLKRVMALDLMGQGDEVSRAVWRAVMRNVLGGATTEDVLKDLSDTLAISYGQTRTLFDTSVSTFQRQVNATGAPDSAGTAFLYTGPVDGKMRPFCRDLVGKVLTRDAIDQLDNGQMANAFLTGGGYNCRHLWTWTAGIAELDALADTGQRVPEVKTALKFVQKPKKAA